MSSHRSRKRIREAKRKARPELSCQDLWIQHRLSQNFDLTWEHVNDTVERIHESDYTEEEFIEKFERPYKVVAIQGCQDAWQAR